MRIAAVSAALLAVMLAGPALAQPPGPQLAAAKSKPAPSKTKETKPSLLTQAQEGDARAQYELGLAYQRGKGVKRNPAEAVSWFALAAAGGVPEAAIAVARAYEAGTGVEKSAVEAARWWFRAGRLGDEAARDRFLDLFLAGETDSVGGTEVGGVEVAEWLEARAQAGDLEAALGLAAMYETGRAVAADPAQAERRYLALALDGNAEARFRLGRMLLQRPAMWRSPDAEHRDDQWTGAVYYASRPTLDKPVYLMRPGMLPAEDWLTAAARQGHAGAQYLLGTAYLRGLDLPFDLTAALGWLEAAAGNNHPDALVALAELAAKGQGFFGMDPVRAWVNYDLAAALGRKDAEAERDLLAKTMSGRQLARARQMSQELRTIRGM